MMGRGPWEDGYVTMMLKLLLVTALFVVSLEAEMIGCIPPVLSGHLDTNAYAIAGNIQNTFYQR